MAMVCSAGVRLRQPIWGRSRGPRRPAAYARLAQHCLGPGQVTRGAETLVDADRLIEQRAGAVDVSVSAVGGACVLGGHSQELWTHGSGPLISAAWITSTASEVAVLTDPIWLIGEPPPERA